MLSVLGEDYIRSAWAKGLSTSRILSRHALRNASIGVMSLLGVRLAELLGGILILEVVFSWPGLGLYAVSSMLAIDFPAIMGVTLVSAIVFSIVNLVVDILYAYLDPRIQFR